MAMSTDQLLNRLAILNEENIRLKRKLKRSRRGESVSSEEISSSEDSSSEDSSSPDSEEDFKITKCNFTKENLEIALKQKYVLSTCCDAFSGAVQFSYMSS